MSAFMIRSPGENHQRTVHIYPQGERWLPGTGVSPADTRQCGFSRFRRAGIFALLAISLCIGRLSAAQYLLPDTLWVKVTFYDFHYGGTNPNFGSGNGGTSRGMIQDTLDRDRKPVFKANVCFNDRIAEWYRPSGGTGATFDPRTGRWTNLARYQTRPNEWVGASFAPAYDMANVVMYDSLPFTIADSATGTYRFLRSNKDAFYWLDNRGFGEEPPGSGHNYGFSMELHKEFLYQGGETFRFAGDDDVWVFVNGKLALDLGGMQSATARSINLDQMASQLGIVKGNTYMFDFFYNERHEPQSDCDITTNILTPAKPGFIIIRTDSSSSFDPGSTAGLGDTVLRAGDSLHLYGFVIDDTMGVQPRWSDGIVWTIYDSIGKPVPSKTFTGDNGKFVFTEAYGTVRIVLSYVDPLNPFIMIRTTTYVTVRPGSADHLVIEASADSTVSLRNDNPLNAVIFTPADSVKYAYAVLRDAYGNWVSASKATTWTSVSATIATAAAGNSATGQGVVVKKGVGETTVWAQNTQASLIKPRDSVRVLVDPFRADTAYDSLRFGVRNNGVTTTITTLTIGVGSDTTLVVQARRESDGAWVDVPAVWTSPPGLRTTSGAPVLQSTWNFVPTVTGQFTVTVSFGGTLSRGLPITVKPGAPVKVVLYPAAGTPDAGQNMAYPAIPLVVTSAAGSALPLTAKAFDAFGFWISDYEVDATLKGMISWSAVNTVTRSADTALGRFSVSAGNPVTYTGTRAYVSADLIVSLQQGAILHRDTMRVTFTAGAATHLVIEGDPNWQVSPNRDNPVDTVRLSTVRQTAPVYAVLRDRYGNFVRYSPTTQWVSGSASVAAAAVGAQDSGQGVLTAGGTTGSSIVTATYTDGALSLVTSSDQVVVLNQSYWYDSLRITTSGASRIENLTMLTSQDTMLLVQGLRDDNGVWENISADWEFVDQVLYNALANPPKAARQWTLSPTGVATGRIRVTLGMDTITTPDTITVEIKPSPPTGITITLLTPPSQRRAGDTLTAVVELRNPDGLMPGAYTFPTGSNGEYARYQDTLGSGGRPDPMVYTGDTTAIITRIGSAGNLIPQRIYNGLDTVKFVLYYAPSDPDSVHKMFLSLGAFSASTDPFTLLPAAVDSVVIVQNGVPVGGDVVLVSPDSARFSVIGYDQWGNPVPVTGRQWSVTGTLGQPADSMKTADQFVYRSAGVTTNASGYVIITVDGVRDSVLITVFKDKPVPGSPVKVALYPAVGIPGAGQNLPYPSIPVVITSVAGAALPLTVKAFDSLDYWLGQYEMDTAFTRMVSWSAVNPSTRLADTSLGRFSVSAGNPVTFTGTKAYASVDLIATLHNGVLAYRDTVRVTFTAGAATHLVIEGDPNWQVSPNRDNPVDTVRLATVRPTAPVYAVLRDRYGNFVRYSPATQWVSGSASVATAAAGAQDSGAGVLTAGGSTGSSVVTATCTDGALALVSSSDQVVVLNQNYWYDSLRITISGASRIENLTMLTSQDTVLRVQGLRDDNGVWENITADWEFVDPVLFNALANPPKAAGQWTLSPTGVATGRIRVTLGMDTITTPDTVTVEIKPAPPSSITITLLTPPSQRRAGDTLTAVVELRNSDGLMPGEYTFPTGGNGHYARYQDTLGSGGRPDPMVYTGDTTAIITRIGSAGNLIPQRIYNGLDTVKFVLYYAPSDPDSVHRIFLSLGAFSASTDPFRLLPAAVDSVVIVRGGVPLEGDIVLMAPSDSLQLAVVGYDRWGNKVTAGMNLQWSVTGTLQQPADSMKTAGVFVYRSTGVTADVNGRILVSVNGVADSVGVFIFGTNPGVDKFVTYAVTRDTNGNGYLDRIEVHLSGLVRIGGIERYFSVIWQGVTLPVLRVAGDTTRADSVFHLILAETGGDQAQTGWTPAVTVSQSAPVRAPSVTARDGAGPVAWRAVYFPTFPGGDPQASFDTLKVSLSEAVRRPSLVAAAVTAGFRYYDGTAGYDPQAPTGGRYAPDAGGQLTNQVVILVPVGSFTITPYEDSLQLVGSTADSAGNAPPPPTVSRRAVIEAGPGNDIRTAAGPNPFIPGQTDVREFLGSRGSTFYRNVIGNDARGAMIVVTTKKPLRLDPDGSYGRVRIYDAVGNVVRSMTLRQAGTGRDYGVMWDGANEAKRYVGNGGYLAMVSVTDIENNSSVQKIRIGIRRQ